MLYNTNNQGVNTCRKLNFKQQNILNLEFVPNYLSQTVHSVNNDIFEVNLRVTDVLNKYSLISLQ